MPRAVVALHEGSGRRVAALTNVSAAQEGVVAGGGSVDLAGTTSAVLLFGGVDAVPRGATLTGVKLAVAPAYDGVDGALSST